MSKVRQLFRFRLLTLLLLITFCAVWLGKLTYDAKRQRKAVADLGKLELRIYYDYQKQADGSYSYKKKPPGPEWFRRLVGEEYFQEVVGVSTAFGGPITAEGMVHLAELPHIEELYLTDSDISDSSLQYIKGLSRITSLVLRGNDITDEGIVLLKGLKRLETLGLTENRIEGHGLQFLRGQMNLRTLFIYENPLNDIGLSHIANIPNLEVLGLSNTPITDEGTKHLVNLSKLIYLSINCEEISDASIEYFEKMKSLRELELFNTKITPERIDRLRVALPKCRINGKGGDKKGSMFDPYR